MSYPPLSRTRVVRRFLFTPLRLSGQTKWLRFVKIRQIVSVQIKGGKLTGVMGWKNHSFL